MRILFLDDMPERYDYFMGLLNRPDIEVDWAKNADEFYPMLENPRYDVFFLDRDLSENDYIGIPSNEQNGEDVAKSIIDLAVDKIPNYIIIHTWNFDGGNNMESILKNINSKILRAEFGLVNFKNIINQIRLIV